MKTTNSKILQEKGFFLVKTSWKGEGPYFPAEYYTTDGIEFYQARTNEFGRHYHLGDAVVMDEVAPPSTPFVKV